MKSNFLLLTLAILVIAISSFGQETETFTDSRDGKIYKTVKIGTQVWMAENLAYLPSVSPSNEIPYDSPCYYVYGYGGSGVSKAMTKKNYTTYGVLYNWEAAKMACPSGWHLPSDDEWKILEKNLGMSEADANSTGWRNSGTVGSKLKEAGTTHWLSPNTDVTNSSGFAALPGGRGCSVGGVINLGELTEFWSSSLTGFSNVFGVYKWERALMNNQVGVNRNPFSGTGSCSIRCIQN